jgi:hypothetical protein
MLTNREKEELEGFNKAYGNYIPLCLSIMFPFIFIGAGLLFDNRIEQGGFFIINIVGIICAFILMVVVFSLRPKRMKELELAEKQDLDYFIGGKDELVK